MQKQNYEDLLFSKYNIRTDLALESHQAVIEREGPPELPGVKREGPPTSGQGNRMVFVVVGYAQLHRLFKREEMVCAKSYIDRPTQDPELPGVKLPRPQ
jgi:hypothetical protein